jgi:hypothetical protein
MSTKIIIGLRIIAPMKYLKQKVITLPDPCVLDRLTPQAAKTIGNYKNNEKFSHFGRIRGKGRCI